VREFGFRAASRSLGPVALALALASSAAGLAVTSGAQARASSTAALTATPVDYGHIALSWSPVSGAWTYRVYRGGLFLGSTTGRSFTDAMLWPQTGYAYRVDALASTGKVLSSPIGSATTGALPKAGFPRPFAATSVWNSPVGNAAVLSSSAGVVAYINQRLVWPNLTLHKYAPSVAEAHPTDPSYSVPCTRYSPCTLGNFGSFRIPATAVPDPSSDGHLVVYDPSSGHEWGMWQASFANGHWSASDGEAVSMTGNGTVPAGTVGSNAANFPLLAGLVRPEEILQGHIDHALVFSVPGVSSKGHVCPATHNDGSSTDPNAPREGMRFRLDPTLNVDALQIPAWQKTIAHALQTYGMYLRDEGGTFGLAGENPLSRGYDAWAKVGLQGASISIAGIPWSRLRLVASPC
jgi:hypothetical protein